MTRSWRRILLLSSVIVPGLVVVLAAASQVPAWGAGALLHPARRPVVQPRPEGCVDATFRGAGIDLAGWRCGAVGPRRGTVIYLHGVADNRAGAAGLARRFGARGFDVVAYDSRAHGDSGGETCTYGFLETRDLRAVVDTLAPGPVVLLGSSLGAAVALQHAAADARVSAVVAAETFADLRTVAVERVPAIVPRVLLERAFREAEVRGRFALDAVSPVAAAARITAPVLLIHGEADTDTLPDHSRRVFAALRGPKRLVLVPGAGHNQSLRGSVWGEIEGWIEAVVSGL